MMKIKFRIVVTFVGEGKETGLGRGMHRAIMSW